MDSALRASEQTLAPGPFLILKIIDVEFLVGFPARVGKTAFSPRSARGKERHEIFQIGFSQAIHKMFRHERARFGSNGFYLGARNLVNLDLVHDRDALAILLGDESGNRFAVA